MLRRALVQPGSTRLNQAHVWRWGQRRCATSLVSLITTTPFPFALPPLPQAPTKPQPNRTLYHIHPIQPVHHTSPRLPRRFPSLPVQSIHSPVINRHIAIFSCIPAFHRRASSALLHYLLSACPSEARAPSSPRLSKAEGADSALALHALFFAPFLTLVFFFSPSQ